MTSWQARQAYELRSLESLGDDAPQVRMCSGDCEEACELIFDFLCSETEPGRGASRQRVMNRRRAALASLLARIHRQCFELS